MKKEIFIPLTLLLLLLGCSSKENYYQLHTLQTQNKHQQSRHYKNRYIGIAEVEVAEYLNKPELSTRISSGRTIVHDNERWREDFSKNIQSVLKYNLSKYDARYTFISYPWEEPIDDNYRIYLTLDKFDGDSNGLVTIEGRWSLINRHTDKILLSESIWKQYQGDKSLENIVDTQSILLDSLSQEMIHKIHSVI